MQPKDSPQAVAVDQADMMRTVAMLSVVQVPTLTIVTTAVAVDQAIMVTAQKKVVME